MEPKTFGKAEKLCSKTLVGRLFGGKSSSLSAWPLRAVFQTVDAAEVPGEPCVQVLVSVSKRYFKRAVKRNRVKRQIREAYRKNKTLLMDAMSRMPERHLLVAFIWQDDKLHESEKVERKMVNLLLRIVEKAASCPYGSHAVHAADTAVDEPPHTETAI